MYKIILTIVISFSILIANTVLADPTEGQDVNKIFLEPIKVKAAKIETTDTKATYASEIYTYEDILKSGATTIYDFLGQNTSLTVVPSSGNQLNQIIEMRGFGLNQGYRSLVITVDGRRLNNIDLSPQNLSSVPLGNIERIEITKGSGSVIYGDSAMAGTIQIYTRNATQTNITGTVGNYGRYTTSINTGASLNKFEISAFADTYEQAGFSDKDPSGKRIEGSRYYYKAKLKYKPTNTKKFFIELENAGSDIRYQNAMTLGVFDQNPGANTNTSDTPTNYQEALTKSRRINLGGTIKFGDHIETTLTYFNEDRETIIFNPIRYKTDIFEGNITLNKGPLKFITGFQRWTGRRELNTTGGFGNGNAKKDNIGIYGQAFYDFKTTTISLGARQEWVGYTFNDSPESYNLQSFDIGINKSINDQLSVFSNYNYAFQTANTDSLFNSTGEFNGFLKPAKSSTINIGLNHRTKNNKLKLTVYGSKLRNEIFLNPLLGSFGTNTTIDKSTKYGLEIQNKHTINKSISAVINYAYTRAIVDEELSSDLCYVDNCKGNDVPGVSAHNLTFGLHYNPNQNSKFILTQKYRSEQFAHNDWRNIFTQKQEAYITTDLAYQYRYKNIEFRARVDNLFERAHGIWVSDNNITPYNYTRNWSLGANIAF
jgi:iron complex outermembrane receptor protein